MFLPLVTDAPLAKAYFEKAVCMGRLSHAYLFLGPEGAGKRRFARELCKAFFCESRSACGDCQPCRSVERGTHPAVDFHVPAEGKTVIDIDTVRGLCARTHYKAVGLRIAVLEQAELLSEPAANALLKTLEEPPPDFVLFLTAQSVGSLLPTIVSRCHRIIFTGGSSDEVPCSESDMAWLEDVSRADFFARQDVRDWLSSGLPKEPGGVRQQVRRLLDMLIALDRSRLEAADRPSLPGRLHRLDVLLGLRQDLDRNVNADLVLERVLRDLRRRPPPTSRESP